MPEVRARPPLPLLRRTGQRLQVPNDTRRLSERSLEALSAKAGFAQTGHTLQSNTVHGGRGTGEQFLSDLRHVTPRAPLRQVSVRSPASLRPPPAASPACAPPPPMHCLDNAQLCQNSTRVGAVVTRNGGCGLSTDWAQEQQSVRVSARSEGGESGVPPV